MRNGRTTLVRSLLLGLLVLLGWGCGSEVQRAWLVDPDGDAFWSLPYPNDLWLDDTGRLRLAGAYPTGDHPLVAQLAALVEGRRGFARYPVVLLRFDGDLEVDPPRLDPRAGGLPAPPPAAVYFVELTDAATAPRRIPAIWRFHPRGDRYLVDHVLAAAPWPGLALRPNRRYALIVERRIDRSGRLSQGPIFRAVLTGRDRTSRLARLLTPLVAAAERYGWPTREWAAATVFTTGDPVSETLVRVAVIAAEWRAELAGPWELLHEEADHCVLRVPLRLPQFQRGTPPFREGGGELVLDAAGRPVLQRWARVPFVLVLPKGRMPARGFPYVEYVHGSGGIATQIVDRGPVTQPGGEETPWRGPGWVAALAGWAAGAHAMPISPDRVTGALDFDYVQPANLAATVGNFQQGLAELWLKEQLVRELALPATLCTGIEAPEGWIRFDASRFAVMGQSMGAMYTNMYAATSTAIVAAIPTGAGGYWSYFLFDLRLVPEVRAVLRLLLGTGSEVALDHLHPVFGLLQHAYEPVDPILYLEHLVHAPLPGRAPRHLYVPMGRHDVYFGEPDQYAMLLAYGVPAVATGEEGFLAGAATDIARWWGLAEAVRMPPIGPEDPTAAWAGYHEEPIQRNGHTIYVQRPEVRHAIRCFLETLAEGRPRIVAVDGAGPEDPCP